MIYFVSNEELEEKLAEKNYNYKIESRKPLDSTPFSYLETIKFIDIKKRYVLKSVHPILKSEIVVHNHVNNDPLTGSHLLFSHLDPNYFLMEKIDFEPLYFFPVKTSSRYYHTLAKKLAFFHLKNLEFVDLLKEQGISEYGLKKYEKIIPSLGSRVEKISQKMNHEIYLKRELVNKFNNNIESIIAVLEPISSTKMTLIHGDFDTGNLIIKNDHQPYAIDYGLAHIDVPIIDIAHLLSATDMNISIRRDIFETYFSLTDELYPEDVSLQDVRQAGRIMHILFFLDWHLFATEKGIVPIDHFYEQIHSRVQLLTNLLVNPHE